MGWFQDILLGLQSTSPTETKYILPATDMPFSLDNPMYVKRIRHNFKGLNLWAKLNTCSIAKSMQVHTRGKDELLYSQIRTLNEKIY